jgi:CRP/FNR family cyclic AMP-dependent transcriptional regulator
VDCSTGLGNFPEECAKLNRSAHLSGEKILSAELCKSLDARVNGGFAADSPLKTPDGFRAVAAVLLFFPLKLRDPTHPCSFARIKGLTAMYEPEKTEFDASAFLANAGLGRRIVQLEPKQTFFSQGDPAESVFYLQKGRAKLTVVSHAGKEATIMLLSAGDFVGEESLAAAPGLRLATAGAITDCTALKITREEMVRVIHEEHAFSDLFLKFLLSRSMRVQADLVDQLFNSSEKRLARVLLLMAEFGRPGEPQTLLPKISQETLAEMIGTTRSRVNFFMNRFRKLGFIEYTDRIRVHKSLLYVVLRDRLPGDIAEKAALVGDEAD